MLRREYLLLIPVPAFVLRGSHWEYPQLAMLLQKVLSFFRREDVLHCTAPILGVKYWYGRKSMEYTCYDKDIALGSIDFIEKCAYCGESDGWLLMQWRVQPEEGSCRRG